jgi:hypothetical protein
VGRSRDDPARPADVPVQAARRRWTPAGWRQRQRAALVTVAAPPGRPGPGVAGYRARFARMGFTASDIDAPSDELVDRLVAWGSTATITARINEYRHAVADQAALTVLDTGHQPVTDPARQLARRLLT